MADNGCFNISTPWNLGIELVVSKYELGLLCKNTIRRSSNSRLYWLYTSYTSGNDEALHNKSYVTESDGRSFMLHSSLSISSLSTGHLWLQNTWHVWFLIKFNCVLGPVNIKRELTVNVPQDFSLQILIGKTLCYAYTEGKQLFTYSASLFFFLEAKSSVFVSVLVVQSFICY